MNKEVFLTFVDKDSNVAIKEVEMIFDKMVEILNNCTETTKIIRVDPPAGMGVDECAEFVSQSLTKRLSEYRRLTGIDLKFDLTKEEGHFYIEPYKTIDSAIKLEWVEHKHRPVKHAEFIEDLLISNEMGDIVPFFHSDMETFCIQTEMVKRLFYTQFFNKEGLLDALGESNRAGEVVKKLFKFNTVSYDEFLAFKPFMNFSESSHQTYSWGESFVSHGGTVLLRVRKLSNTSDIEYSHWYIITKKEEKQLCRPVDYVNKLNELYKVCFKPKEEKGDETAQ